MADDNKAKLLVELPLVDGFHVLIAHKTGVVYEQQCGGWELDYPREEGFLVPCWQTHARGVEQLLDLARHVDFGAEFRALVQSELSVFLAPDADQDPVCHRLEVDDDAPRYGWVRVKAGPWHGWLIWANDKGIPS
ncbi:hypothetical protein [Paremcibacter congregatus]|uniref:hypothetical protein n=1 Tax=Paremcibacter congregatus TaxID=2043170 RepID=UPI003A9566FB